VDVLKSKSESNMEPLTVPSSIPTPIYKHLNSDEFEDVYEPAEDSFLLLDALESELQFLEKVQPSICVEIGPGSGIISAAIGSVFRSKTFVISCDINPQACICTSQTLVVNNCQYSNVIRSDLLSGLQQRAAGLVDLIVCNPPYVPTSNEEEGSSDIRASWAGGHQGLTLIQRLVELIPNLLSKSGVAYIVFEDQNKPHTFMEESSSKYGLKSEIVLKRKAGRELLYVLKFTKESHT